MTTKCYRCGNIVPEPDVKEAIARESDWRNWLDDHPDEAFNDEERVLICIQCADEIAEDDE